MDVERIVETIALSTLVDELDYYQIRAESAGTGGSGAR